MKKTISSFLFLALLSSILLSAKLPDLSVNDVNPQINEILHAHVTQKTLTPTLIRRSISNFIEELDPGKVYFISEEVKQFEELSDDRVNDILLAFKNDDFSCYEEIYQIFCDAIPRRKELETENTEELKDVVVNTKEFTNMQWAENTEQLQQRLQKIQAFQYQTAEKLDLEIKEHFYKLITKRRNHREGELLPASLDKRKILVYTYIIKATAQALDSQTAYFTPDEATSFMIQVQQRIYGIGVQLRDDLTGIMVVKIIEGGPAEQSADLKLKDKIIAVDNEPVVGMDITEAVALMKGKEGTKVKLTVLRENSEANDESNEPRQLDIEIVRGEVVLKEARIESDYVPFGDGIIAHIKLHSFYQDPQNSSAFDIYESLLDLKKKHKLKGVILDLRNNAGGLLPQAVAVTGLFIGKGIVASIKNSDGSVQHLRNVEPNKVWNGPLIVLINRLSASASEIVAQALQDYGRAIIVGDDHTFGKGTFQIFTLDTINHGSVNPKGEYKVTKGMYFTVSGKSPQLVGVESDVTVPGGLSELEIGEKHSKYPLETASIKENFNDDLSDIPLRQRNRVRKYYRYNLQPRLSHYTKHVQMLVKNSSMRMIQNNNYQNFLYELKSEETDITEIYGQNDLQLEETVDVMKDLIMIIN